METVVLNHLIEQVHHIREHKTFRNKKTIIRTTITIIILDHNHLTMIEMEIVHGDQPHVIAFIIYEITLIHS